MSNASNSATKLKMDDWLKKCVKYLNGTAYDAINGNTELLSFSTSKTTVIPPIPDYKKIMRSQGQHPFLGPSTSEVLKNDTDVRACTRGFETETSVSKYFETFGLGGIYISDLKILELMRGYRKENDLQPFLPDVKEVHKFLKDNSSIQIDGILIHPKIGIAVIEIKAVEYSKETSEQQHNRLPKIIFGEKGVKVQLNNYEKFIKEFFGAIFGKEIPFPVQKIACAPNADTGQISVTEDIHLLDKNAFHENGENFKLFWNQMMTLETKISNQDFIQFAAVLITLKTSFGLVSTFNSNIISTSYDFLNEQRLILHDTARKQPTEMKQTQMKLQDKLTYFWLTCEQLKVYEWSAGKYFIMGPPGSGKTLLLKARILKYKEKEGEVRIFCPYSLTFQYQQFIRDNDLQDKVKVLSFSELINIAKLFRKCEVERTDFYKSRYGYILSPDINIYCDEIDDRTYRTKNIRQLFELRPDDVETFVIGESPDAFRNPIFGLSEAFKNSGYLTTSLKTMMRSSIEIIEYFLSLNRIAAHVSVRAGHSLTFKGVITITCLDKNEAIKNIVDCINIKKEHYNYSDMAIITLKHQTDDIKNAINNSDILTKHIEDNAGTPAITILTPFQSKSYEWKMVIVWIDFDHEQEALPLAVTRASVQLVIIKQLIYSELTKQQNQEKNRSTTVPENKTHIEEVETKKESMPRTNDVQNNKTNSLNQNNTPHSQSSALDEHRVQSDNNSTVPFKECFSKDAHQIDNNHMKDLNQIKIYEKHVGSSVSFNSDATYRNKQDCTEIKHPKAKLLYKNAERGDPEAQYNLGMSYAKGQDVLKSKEEAVKWYTKSAEQGFPQAQYRLGVSYAEGEGVPQSEEEAVKWYRKAAEQGNAKAQLKLGGMCNEGKGIPKSAEEAVKWYRISAEQGNTNAQYNLALHYYNGQGVPQSDEEAVKWYKKAAEQGDPEAQYNLGVHYDNGYGVPQSDEKAVKWYRKAAQQGCIDAQYNLGVHYDIGQGVPQSDEEAVKWFRKVAEKSHAQGQYSLGLSYAEGRGVLQSDEEAVKWYRKAAEQNDALAQFSLGAHYENGQGVPQSHKEAVKWYRRAAEQGDSEAQYSLGVSYGTGQGVPQSHEEAVTWFRKAAEQSHVIAQYTLGVSYAKGRGVPESDEKAGEWFRKAAQQGNPKAQFYLGMRYTKGQGDEEAINWFTKTAEQGDPDAQYYLGMSYDKGREVSQSHEEAVKWYTKSAEQGFAQAQYRLGVSYAKGQGVPQCYQEAVKWYRKAAEQGHAEAQYNLGVSYTTGQGTLQSYEKGMKWYTRSAEQGNANARAKLKGMSQKE